MARLTRRRRQGELLAAASGILLFIIVISMLTWVRDQPSPLDPTPVPGTDVAQQPTVTSAPTLPATPRPAGPTVRPGSLRDLLRYSPDRLSDNSLPLADVLQYADIAGWMDARGVPDPTTNPDTAEKWRTELRSLAIPSVIATRGQDRIWQETYGFSLNDVDQVLAVGEAPDYVLIMRGSWDPNALHDAWVRGGYQAVRSDKTTLWSLYPDDAVNLSAPASRPALGNMNNVVLLDDGTLIATARLSRLKQAVKTYNRQAPSMADNARIETLVTDGTDPDRLVSAVVLKGTILAVSPSTPIAASVMGATPAVRQSTPSADGAPPLGLMLAGLMLPDTPGEVPRMSLVLEYPDADKAAEAADRADLALRVGQSPVTGKPFHTRTTLRSIRTVATSREHIAVHVDVVLRQGSADWRAILEQRDLAFLRWTWTP